MDEAIIAALLAIEDDTKHIVLSDNRLIKIKVGPIDRDAGKLLKLIAAAFAEKFTDKGWLTEVLSTAQFWATLGATIEDDIPAERVPVDSLPPDPNSIEPVPHKEWHS